MKKTIFLGLIFSMLGIFLFEHALIAAETLPFVGKRLFNFMGGSGTEQSITISKDGKTKIMFHGVTSSSTEYKGKFTNPIKLKDGTGYLFKDDKVYLLQKNGKVEQGCKDDGVPCVSELYK